MSDAQRQRLARLAANLSPHGERILDQLLASTAVDKLAAAAAQGLPPVVEVEALLTRETRPALSTDAVRRFIGTVVAAALAERGFSVARKHVRVPGNTPFSVGATYEKTAKPAANTGDELLRAMVRNLSPDQRKALVALIQETA